MQTNHHLDQRSGSVLREMSASGATHTANDGSGMLALFAPKVVTHEETMITRVKDSQSVPLAL